MSEISIQNLTFCYDGSYDNIFENVSFRIDTDWKLGFTGRNGRGKTTFLNLLQGKYEYSGNISSSVTLAYFPFAFPDETEPIAGQLGCRRWELERELGRLGLPGEVLDRPFRTLSNGEQTKVKLAVLFLQDDDYLLIDEPTNHLDAKGRAIVAAYLAGKKGFLLVSHDRAFLDAATDHTVWISKTSIEIQAGNFSEWYRNKQLRDRFEKAENERLQKEIWRLAASAVQAGRWADQVEGTKIGGGASRSETKSIGGRAYIGEKSRRMQQRRKNLERSRQTAIEEKAGLLRNLEQAEALCIRPLSYRAELLAEFRDFSLFYDSRKICGGITFTIQRGDRIALRGDNGSGKSSLLKRFAGEEIICEGSLYKAGGLKLSWVPQDASFLCGSLDTYAARRGIDLTRLKTILRKLDFSRVQFGKNMEHYSEGQKKKVLIACSLCEEAHLYIWDEPLNYVDIFSRIQIEELLLQYKPTMLFIEHDAAFCERIRTKTVDITRE